MENGKLIIWEPIQNNPFDRFKEPMVFVSMYYDIESFELTFTTFTNEKEFKVSYKRDETNFYAIRHFRILEEPSRGDIETLLVNRMRKGKL